MKIAFLLLLQFLGCLACYAQNVGAQRKTLMEIRGIVQDTSGNALVNATIKLTAGNDSLFTVTDEEGIFGFKDVKQPWFTLSVNALGYSKSVQKYKIAGNPALLTLDPIALKHFTQQLAEVNISGTPSITYKTDTVEYRAKDYKGRANDNVEELLKKMEGMSVSPNGLLTYQGQEIKKAKLNGKLFSGGDVAQAIKNLPAEIVDRIQIVDDYGEQVARTGIKSGDPIRILNIATRADKSIGNMLNNSSSIGTNERYKQTLFLQRLNGNKQYGIIGNINNVVNGVSDFSGKETSDDNSGASLSKNQQADGSGGKKLTSNNSISYRDTWGPYIQINAAYNYINSNNELIKNSFSQLFNPLGNTYSTNAEVTKTREQIHSLNLEVQLIPDSSNYFLITPVLSYEHSTGEQVLGIKQSGLINQDLQGKFSLASNKPTYGAVAFYQHVFSKPRRNISLQTEIILGHQKLDNEQYNHLTYSADPLSIKDSLSNRIMTRNYGDKSVKGVLTYTEPLGKNAQVDFIGEWNLTRHDNQLITNNLEPASALGLIDSLSTMLKYSFTRQAFAIDYHLNKNRYAFSVGLKTIAAQVLLPVGIQRQQNANIYVIPVLRLQYNVSRTQQFTASYSGDFSEPAYYQLLSAVDYTNPLNPVKGNPELKPSFGHYFLTNFNNYIPNSRFNISVALKAAILQNAVATNTKFIYQPALNNYVNQTTFENSNGGVNGSLGLNLSKQISSRQYSIEYNGIARFSRNPFLNEGVKNFNSYWRISQNLGPKLLFGENVEVNPYVGYIWYKSQNTLPNAVLSNIRTTTLNLENKVYLSDWQLGLTANKNFINGIDRNIAKNPFLLNAYLQKDFLKRRKGTLKIEVYDLFNENNFVNRILTDNSITDTRSNTLSRYFLLTFRLNLQSWNGTPTKNGKAMKRRNDGSFID